MCPYSYLLHSCQALELGAAQVLLLKCSRLQHKMLLLCCVHLLQVLGRSARLPVQGLLDHLGRVERGRLLLASWGSQSSTCCSHGLRGGSEAQGGRGL